MRNIWEAVGSGHVDVFVAVRPRALGENCSRYGCSACKVMLLDDVEIDGNYKSDASLLTVTNYASGSRESDVRGGPFAGLFAAFEQCWSHDFFVFYICSQCYELAVPVSHAPDVMAAPSGRLLPNLISNWYRFAVSPHQSNHITSHAPRHDALALRLAGGTHSPVSFPRPTPPVAARLATINISCLTLPLHWRCGESRCCSLDTRTL